MLRLGILQQKWLVLALALVGFACALLAASWMSVDTAQRMLVEGGPVEIVSTMLQFAVAAVALLLWWRLGGLFGMLAIGAFLMGAREIDLHTAFTMHGIFSTKEYVRPEVPVAERLLALAALVVIAGLLAGGARAGWQEMVRLGRTGAPAIYGLATVVALLPVLKMFDALPRMMREVGMPVGTEGLKYLLALEEVGEMVLPVLVGVVLLQLLGTTARSSPSVPIQSRTSGRYS